MTFPVSCVDTTRDSIVKVRDIGSTAATFQNSKRSEFKRIRFDDCVVRNQRAADWVVEKVGTGQLIVELKGTDVVHAINQIQATIEFLIRQNSAALRIAGLVVCTRYPRVDTRSQLATAKFVKKMGVPVRIKTKAQNLDFDALLDF